LNIDSTTRIIDHQLKQASLLGVNDVRVVTGFQATKIETHLQEYKTNFNILDTIYNPFYKSTNNLISLWLALQECHTSAIVVNGDSVHHPSIYHAVVNSLEQGVSCIPIAKKESYDYDDTKCVLSASGKLLRIDKSIDKHDISAEWMGIFGLTEEAVSYMKHKINNFIQTPSLIDGPPHYLTAINDLLASTLKVNAPYQDNTLWAEVDFKSDLDYLQAFSSRFLNKS